MDGKNIFSKTLPFKRRELILHPFNIIILFIINTSLQKTKAGLSVGFMEPALSLIIILAFSVLIYFVFRRLMNEQIKAGIFLSYILIVTLFFRDIVEFIIYFGISDLLNFMGEYFIAIIFALIFFALLSKWLIDTDRKLIKFNSYLNLLTAIFLLVEIAGCSFSDVSKVRLKENVELKTYESFLEKPDVYFILLDGYTGFSGLEKLCKFDNSELRRFLSENDFFIAENGQSVYNVTNYSMASTFNMTELIYSKDDLYSKGNYLTLAHFIKNNNVVKYFYNAEYSFFNLSFWDINDKDKLYEDIYFLRRGNIYQARTLYGHLYEIYNEKFEDMAEINPGIFQQLKTLNQTETEKPKFVYAHITMPHPPYYFNAEGKRMDFTYSSDGKDLNKYLEQLIYTNKLLINTIKSIMDNSKNKPVIIVQSDHGFRSYTGKDKAEIEFSVLNTFYFPDKNYSMLNDSLKTINTFRILFNKYFNQNLAIE